MHFELQNTFKHSFTVFTINPIVQNYLTKTIELVGWCLDFFSLVYKNLSKMNLKGKDIY